MHKYSLFILAIASNVFIRFPGADAAFWNVTIYEDPSFRKKLEDLHGDSCKNVKANHHDKASSINTHDTCVKIWKELDCTGDKQEVKPGSQFHWKLSELGFDNVLSSIGPC
ncbi:uncharacterized protein [Bemisia tabaci]|uniref:uncharacterized protein n=1 Tax=Bemisia tabaci TaxID=7038 RepID=UPI003B27EDE2